MVRFSFILTLFCGVFTAFVAVAALPQSDAPIVMDANELIYEKNAGTITAMGAVEVVQGGRILRAKKIIYNIGDDFAYAEGGVVLVDPSGDTHFAQRLELSDQMRRGVLTKLYSELEDGSRLWAKTATRESPQKHVLKDARYTPCKACETNSDETPTWAIRAADVTHDKDNALISYEDMRFEAWGVPIMYAPYFSHPDGSVEQKSGFLTPQIGFGSDFGFNVMVPYYHVIDPSLDVTAGLRFFTRETPQLNLEVRKRFSDALLTVETSMAHSKRTEIVNGVEREREKDLRGHVNIEGLWNIDRKWRAGSEIYLASDEQYLDQYDIDDEDVLENRLYVERFDNRDYASVELLAFQDLRTDLNVDQPNALPFANMGFVGAPNSALGGRFAWDSSFLSLFREGNEQDMNRLSSTMSWQRQDILPFGLTSQVDFAMRGDVYYTKDRDIAKINANEKQSKFDNRFIPTANLEIAYPLQKRLSKSQIVIKPMVSITARPDVDNDSKVPNEDSQDAQIDTANLFDLDRFPGLDRVEDRTRVNYGTHVGYYSDAGDEFSAFLGQSYRFNNTDNPFQNGSGLNEQASDIVGQVNASFDNNKHNLNYRVQIDGQSLNAERHEVYAGIEIYDTRLSTMYLFEKGSKGTEFANSRQQIRLSSNHKIDENWSVIASGLYDFGEDEGLRESQLGIGYDDDCFGITLVADRDLQTGSSGANKTTVFARFRLKNLGEFETTAYSGSSGGSSTDQ